MHLQRPQISIVIPTLNRATWLGQALQSALAQTRHPGIEVVVVDNASTDNTWDIIQAFCNSAVRAIKNARTLNICDNWQSALEAARGDYVLILGDDDCLFPQWGEVMLQTLNQAMQQGNAPAYIAWNHITYIASHPLAGWRNLLMYPRTLTGKTLPVNGESLRNTYLRQPASMPFPVPPHPSLLLFHRAQIDAVCKRHNTRWFDGLYPDYHAAVLAGGFSTEGLFIDQALVCIGGVEKRYYCRKQSKMERFSEGQQTPTMPDLGDGFGAYSPYLALNIARQMVYSCRIVGYDLDQQALLQKLIPETIENIWFCECVFGQGSHSADLEQLAKKFGADNIQHLLIQAKKTMRRAQLNKWLLTGLGQNLNIALRAVFKRPMAMAAPSSVTGLDTAVQWYVQHQQPQHFATQAN